MQSIVRITSLSLWRGSVSSFSLCCKSRYNVFFTSSSSWCESATTVLQTVHRGPPLIKGEPPMLLAFLSDTDPDSFITLTRNRNTYHSLSRNFFLQPLYPQICVLKSTLLHQILLRRIRVKILHFSRSVYQYCTWWPSGQVSAASSSTDHSLCSLKQTQFYFLFF